VPLPLKTIAIVDDDSSAVSLLSAIVTDMGYQVVGTAQNGRDAIDLVKRTGPQVLLLDVHMPLLDGLAATPAIVDLGTTAVVLLTGDSNPEIARQAMDLGACGYLQKALDSTQLSAIMETAWHRFQTVLALKEKNRLLDEALETRKLIEKAKGILMEQQGFKEEEAHRCLLKMSQDQGLPMKDVCRSIIQVRMILGKKSGKVA